MRKLILVGCTSFFAHTAHAQDVCANYVGQTVAPMIFDEAVSAFATLPARDEFESTAQYAARRAAALAGVPETLVISKAPEDEKFFEYDADSQRLRIISYAFDNMGFDARRSFINAGLEDKIDASVSGTVDVVISQSETVTGTYEGSNSFGASAVISEIQRDIGVIFDRSHPDPVGSLFPAAAEKSYVVGELSLSPADARALKPTLKLAFVVTPKEPYYVESGRTWGPPTIQKPHHITEKHKILIADIRCGLVTDGADRVLGAYPTN